MFSEKNIWIGEKATTTADIVRNKVIKKIRRERKYECKLEAAQKKYEENLMYAFHYDSLLKKMKDTSR